MLALFSVLLWWKMLQQWRWSLLLWLFTSSGLNFIDFICYVLVFAQIGQCCSLVMLHLFRQASFTTPIFFIVVLFFILIIVTCDYFGTIVFLWRTIFCINYDFFNVNRAIFGELHYCLVTTVVSLFWDIILDNFLLSTILSHK